MVVGIEVWLPWAGKRGKVEEWKGILVGPKSSKFVYSCSASLTSCPPRLTNYRYIHVAYDCLLSFYFHFTQTNDL